MKPTKTTSHPPKTSTTSKTSAKKGFPTWAAVAGGLLALLLLLAVVGCNDDSPGSGASDAAGEDVIAHVHGLGINPADGALYAATHYGLFRVPDQGKAERIGDVVQDTMGFTVVGPDHFLASGHPDLSDERLNVPGKPPLLGLIESTDAGRTWDPVSLLGEADFHSLVAAHDQIYGYDSTTGRLMVSADGKEWETRSQARMGDFAVDPLDADHLVAMTEQGLAETSDGGRTWQQLDGPQLVLLSWDERQGLWGVTPEGQTYRRTEQTWEPGGALPGPPQALLVTGDDLYAAVSEGESTGIYVSTDGGQTWEVRYSDQQS